MTAPGRFCCCGGGGGDPIPGCAEFDTCDDCGDLEWRVRGTLIRDIVGGGGALVQREIWAFTSLDIVTANVSVSGRCRWLNNFATSGSNADFLTYGGTYTLIPTGGTIRSATNFLFTAPASNLAWQVDSTCDLVTFVETMEVDLTGGATPYRVADDQDGTLLDVTPPFMQFSRNSTQDCPIGTFNAVEPVDSFDYPSLPYLDSVDI